MVMVMVMAEKSAVWVVGMGVERAGQRSWYLASDRV